MGSPSGQLLPAGCCRPSGASPGQWKDLSVLEKTLGTVQAPVCGSTHQPGWFLTNSAMHTHSQATSLKLPAGCVRCVG